MKRLAVCLAIFTISPWLWAQPELPHEIFISRSYLKRILYPDQSLQFEACDRVLNKCRAVTRQISAAEIRSEAQSLEMQSRFRFRGEPRVGALLFSETKVCTIAGIVIASVPGLAGGAVICIHSGGSGKVEMTELPLNIQALDRLERELGDGFEVVARGEEGDVFVANLELIFKFLKQRYPLEDR